MDEFSLIHAMKQKTYKQASLIKGVGDDAAIFRETANDLVVTVDTFVEGVHFTKKTMSAFHVGYRALAANFSDIAAMGAIPVYYLVSISVSNSWGEHEIANLYLGMKELADEYGVDLIGGDTVSSDLLMLSITVIGRVEKDKARYRHTAKPNDIVFVTGTLGDARAGLYLLQNDFDHIEKDYFIVRHRMPNPRIAFARAIKGLNRVALNDISDGLANEAHEIADASGVTLILNDDCVPVHSGYCLFPEKYTSRWKYFGGEDFELLGTVPKEAWSHIKQKAGNLNLKVTEIGYVVETREYPVYLNKNNQLRKLQKAGYTHLSR